MILKFDLVSQEPSDSTESLHELEAFLRLVSDELKLRSKLGIVCADPLGERLSLDDVVGNLSLSISKELLVLFLSGVEDQDLGVSLNWVLEHISVGINVFEKHKGVQSS